MGELARDKKKLDKDDKFSIFLFLLQEDERKRINPSIHQMKTVSNIFKDKCAICGNPYEYEDYFAFHHIDGKCNKTFTPNLALVCLGCHKKIHSLAKSKLKD